MTTLLQGDGRISPGREEMTQNGKRNSKSLSQEQPAEALSSNSFAPIPEHNRRDSHSDTPSGRPSFRNTAGKIPIPEHNRRNLHSGTQPEKSTFRNTAGTNLIRQSAAYTCCFFRQERDSNSGLKYGSQGNSKAVYKAIQKAVHKAIQKTIKKKKWL